MERSTRKILIALLWLVLLFWIFGYAQDDIEIQNTIWSQDQSQFVQTLRTQAIKQLIENKFDRWETLPFGPGNDSLVLTWSQVYPTYPNFVVNKEIDVKDDLDTLLAKKMQEMSVNHSLTYELPTLLKTGQEFSFANFTLSEGEIKQLKKVYLFKNQQDLETLGYVVSSYRTRINTDSKSSGRRDNISISYWNLGNVRVLNPGQEISFMDEIHYDPSLKNKRDTVSGRANIWGIRQIKGWGICGAAWWINAVIRPNKAFEVTERFNHSRTYKNLYKNTINGKESWIPGLDIAVYSFPGSVKDFKFKNIREYPVVLVMNFDGTEEWMEELFVLGKETDRGELTYEWRQWNCFFWNANGEPFKSCYGAISW